MKNRLVQKKYYLSTNPNMWLRVTRVDAHLDELESIIVKHDKLIGDKIEWISFAPRYVSGEAKCKRGSEKEKWIQQTRRLIDRISKRNGPKNDDDFYETFKKCAGSLTPCHAGEGLSFGDAQYLAEKIKNTKIFTVQPKPRPAPIVSDRLVREPEQDLEPVEIVSSNVREKLYQRMIKLEVERRMMAIESAVVLRLARIEEAIGRRFPDEAQREKCRQEFIRKIRQQEMDAYK